MAVNPLRTAFELIISLENVIRIVQGEYAASIEATFIEYRINYYVGGDMTREQFLGKRRFQFKCSRIWKCTGEGLKTRPAKTTYDDLLLCHILRR
jgi:hypothetical protein